MSYYYNHYTSPNTKMHEIYLSRGITIIWMSCVCPHRHVGAHTHISVGGVETEAGPRLLSHHCRCTRVAVPPHLLNWGWCVTLRAFSFSSLGFSNVALMWSEFSTTMHHMKGTGECFHLASFNPNKQGRPASNSQKVSTRGKDSQSFLSDFIKMTPRICFILVTVTILFFFTVTPGFELTSIVHFH